MTESITVQDLSKQFWIGQSVTTGLREALTDGARRLVRRQRRTRTSIWALKDVSFGVKTGEVLGIIGANGAGKSTLLKLLSKITYPTSGTIAIHGRVASLLEVGTGFHEELTGRENVFLNGSIMGMTRAEIRSRFDAIVEFSGVGPFIDTPLKRYSSGMRLRLGFAVAAHLDPDILLIDEVLSVGDAGFQKKCMRAVDDLRGGGRTVLFVSHDMAAVENLCPRTIWIDNGRVRKDGPTVQTITAYMSTFADARSAGYDLTKATRRRGNGEIRFTKVEFLDAARMPKALIRGGDDLTIRLHYRSKGQVRLPMFGIEIYTELGTLVSEMSTYTTGLEIPKVEEGDGFLDLVISFLNLMPGRYFFTLWAGATGPVFYDVLDHCDYFDVEASDFYESGKGLDSRLGIVFLPCKWTHCPPQDPGLGETSFQMQEDGDANRAG